MKKHSPHTLRAAIAAGAFLVWLVLIGARAGYLQIQQGAWLSHKAAVQYESELVLEGKRGTIYDRRHEAMAVSIETTSVAAYPAMIEDKYKAAHALSKVLHLPSGELKKHLSSGRSFVWIKRQATPKDVESVKALKLKGIDFLPAHSRFYPNTTLAAQVLGFTGTDGHGLEGVEFYYDAELKGSERKITVIKDALGRNFDAPQSSDGNQAGNNLVLTIDRHVQYIAEQALMETVTKNKARSGMALVMVPRSGELLAIAHYPFLNPNAFGSSDQFAWRNRAITDAFEPGSTMKIFSAAAALENGSATPATIYYCENGTYLVGDHTVHDTKPHGWLSVQQIVKYSSNIGAVKIAEQIGPHTLYRYLQAFGFGDRLHLDCPGESAGILPNYTRWTSVDTGAIAFGQGISATALQVITAASALANDGVLMRPYIVQAIMDANGRPLRKIMPEAVRQVVSASTAMKIRSIMRSVITDGGTGTNADVDGYNVCGKTGTAQKLDANGTYSRKLYVSSFVGFAPTERPEIAVLVVVDEPQVEIYGGQVAAPAFAQIVRETLGYMNVAPSDDWKKLRVSAETRISG